MFLPRVFQVFVFGCVCSIAFAQEPNFEVTQNRNSIAVSVKLDGTKEDVPLKADGKLVHPLVFNPDDNLHHSMIWQKEGTTIEELRAELGESKNDVVATCSTTCLKTLNKPVKPKVLERLWVKPKASGTGKDENDPGALHSILANLEDNTEVILMDGVYNGSDLGAGENIEEFMATIAGGKTNIRIVAENSRKAVISNLLKTTEFSSSSVGTAGAGVWRIDNVPRPISQIHVELDGIVYRLQEWMKPCTSWSVPTLEKSPNGGWFIDTTTPRSETTKPPHLYVKLPTGADVKREMLKVSNTDRLAALHFKNANNIWIEGIVFEYWLNTASNSPPRIQGSSLSFEQCHNVVVRDCESRHTMTHAIDFLKCEEFVVEECDFIDRQKYVIYDMMRHAPAGNLANAPRFSGTVRCHQSKIGSIRHNRWNGCFGACRIWDEKESESHIEFHHNLVSEARNHPLNIQGAGKALAIWSNHFRNCANVMPGNEAASPISPVYWINNLATGSGYLGSMHKIADNGIHGSRFGGTSPSGENKVGQHFFYYNTNRVTWFPPKNSDDSDKAYADILKRIKRLDTWADQGRDHSGSRYYNNIFTCIARDSIVDNYIIFYRDKVGLQKMEWDHNQYAWEESDEKKEPFRMVAPDPKDQDKKVLFNFKALRDSVPKWEPNGKFQDPKFDVDSKPAAAIKAKQIDGVTNNEILGMPGSSVGAHVGG